MRKTVLYTLNTPYRESLSVEGFEFGNEDAKPVCAIVGSMRGNEVQQTFICADLVRRLKRLEERGLTDPTSRILVVPSVNSFSMNIDKRFWPVDNTDINRMFPGYDAGETTQRIAAGLFEAVKDFEYGIQLASFYLPGEFLSHVRITDTGFISTESLALAQRFGLPYVMLKRPSSFDTTTLNYNWQVWDTKAFSVFSKETDSIDARAAHYVEDCILRFLNGCGAVRFAEVGGYLSHYLEESDLVSVRSEQAGGFLMRKVEAGEHVSEGDVLGEVLDTADAHVKDRLRSPVEGTVFFCRTAPLINQYTIAFEIAPEEH